MWKVESEEITKEKEPKVLQLEGKIEKKSPVMVKDSKALQVEGRVKRKSPSNGQRI
jgi:hypothetical protein